MPSASWPLAALEAMAMRLLSLSGEVLGSGASKAVAWVVGLLFAGLWGIQRLLGALAGRDVSSLLVEMLSSAHLGQRDSHPQLGFSASDLPPELPAPVGAYLRAVLPEGEPPPKLVLLRQRGRIRFVGRSAPLSAWLKATAEQWACLAPRPAFVWSASLELGPLLWIRGCAAYLAGRGSVTWKLLSLLPVMAGGGEEGPSGHARAGRQDRAALLRFLADAPAYPAALLPSPYLRWEAAGADPRAARATISDRGVTASATFHFSEGGAEVEGMSANEGAAPLAGGSVSADPWVVHYSGYRRLGGCRVPTSMESSWVLPAGELYPYAQLELEEVRGWQTVELSGPGGGA